eukprot:Skav213733  [mRNA]  locus=scaffold2563:347557:347892:- [translate_table: standard]
MGMFRLAHIRGCCFSLKARDSSLIEVLKELLFEETMWRENLCAFACSLPASWMPTARRHPRNPPTQKRVQAPKRAPLAPPLAPHLTLGLQVAKRQMQVLHQAAAPLGEWVR